MLNNKRLAVFFLEKMMKKYMNIFNNSKIKIYPTMLYHSSKVKPDSSGSRVSVHEYNNVPHDHSFVVIINWST